MSAQQPKRGERFRHARFLDPAWIPGPGQRYTDAPHLVMHVTRVANDRVWYGSNPHRASHVIAVEDLPNIVEEWLT